MKPSASVISLKNMRFHAFHGVLPQERTVGNDYEVNLSMHVEISHETFLSDNLEGTVNYAEAYGVIKRVMNTPSQLLEHVAHKALKALFITFPRIDRAEIEICKLAPPIVGDVGSACVRLEAINPLQRPIRLIIYDFDGTLADTSQGIVRTMQATFKKLNLPIPAADAIKQTIGLPLGESFNILSNGATINEIGMTTYCELFGQIGVPETKAFHHVNETLCAISTEGILQAIASSRETMSLTELTHKIGIARHIKTTCAGDDVKRAKPSPEMALRLMEENQCEPWETLVVGDTTFDIEMGKRAGCATCAVTYGNQDIDQLKRSEPDYIVDDCQEIIGIIERRKRKND